MNDPTLDRSFEYDVVGRLQYSHSGVEAQMHAFNQANDGGGWQRGYLGGQLLALQRGGVLWVHQDPVVKSQRLTDFAGDITASLELDAWGGETSRSVNSNQQPSKFTTYDRDLSGNDQAMLRQYHSYWMRFDQPDPYGGSYNMADPQSFNRYNYVQNDPVNYVDPSGLNLLSFFKQLFGTKEGAGIGNWLPSFDDSAWFAGGWWGGVDDLAAGGGDGSPNPQWTIDELMNSIDEELLKKMNDCLTKVFGEDNAKKIGALTKSNIPSVRAHLTSQEMHDKYGRKTDPLPYMMPVPWEGQFGTIYMARDFLGRGYSIQTFQIGYVHEQGNIISHRLAGNFFAFGKPKPSDHPKNEWWDDDSGKSFSDCVFGLK